MPYLEEDIAKLNSKGLNMEDLITKLRKIVGEEIILSADQSKERSAGFWAKSSHLNVKGLARPTTTEQVSQIMKYCHEIGQTVVPHGGLSNLTFATEAGPDDLILSLERMNAIEEIDTDCKTVIVQAGVILQNLQEKIEENNLLFPLDLGARGSCMIGGNIATNAGGIQVLRYGTMRQLVLGLEVVLPDGRIISSLNKMLKDNAGYDLKQLFIGSEGTLGIITKASLKLVAKPTTRNTAFVGINSFSSVIQFLKNANSSLSGTLTSFELIWKDYYQFMTESPSPYNPPLERGYSYYVLFETQGVDAENDSQKFESFLETAMEQGVIEDAAIAFTQSDHSWFWGIRENVEILFSLGMPLYVFDVSLPIPQMENYIHQIDLELLEKFKQPRLFVFGHMGDGNLHIAIKTIEEKTDTRSIVEEIVYRPLVSINGSITAEHGIGLEKKNWLHISRSPTEIQVMKELKKTLDTKGILNPNKIFNI